MIYSFQVTLKYLLTTITDKEKVDSNKLHMYSAVEREMIHV